MAGDQEQWWGSEGVRGGGREVGNLIGLDHWPGLGTLSMNKFYTPGL